MTLNKMNMFKTYFLVIKILMLISAAYFLRLQFLDFHWSSLIFSSATLLITMIQFIAIHKAERLIREKHYLGIIIGLVVSVLYLGSIMLPLGLWGLYSLLNREFMNEHAPTNAPSWFSENIIHSKVFTF